jgi:hypothetical protein
MTQSNSSFIPAVLWKWRALLFLPSSPPILVRYTNSSIASFQCHFLVKSSMDTWPTLTFQPCSLPLPAAFGVFPNLASCCSADLFWQQISTGSAGLSGSPPLCQASYYFVYKYLHQVYYRLRSSILRLPIHNGRGYSSAIAWQSRSRGASLLHPSISFIRRSPPSIHPSAHPSSQHPRDLMNDCGLSAYWRRAFIQYPMRVESRSQCYSTGQPPFRSGWEPGHSSRALAMNVLIRGGDWIAADEKPSKALQSLQ